jgi:hypothetical protein
MGVSRPVEYDDDVPQAAIRAGAAILGSPFRRALGMVAISEVNSARRRADDDRLHEHYDHLGEARGGACGAVTSAGGGLRRSDIGR